MVGPEAEGVQGSVPVSPEEALEDQRYDEQYNWILQNYGGEAASKANYGWCVDEGLGVICTKVYGFGVLSTNIETGKFYFEEY